MIRTVYAKWLWDSRRSLLGWTAAIVLVGSGYAAFWPTINNPDLLRLLDNYPQALLEALNYTDFASVAGYLSATVYGLIVGLLMLVFAVAAGTRIIAGEEEAGILDLTLAHPVSRPSLALQRFAALATSVVAIVTVFWLVMLVLAGPAQFDTIPPARLAAMHAHLAAFTILFGAISFAVGAATGRRALALAAGAGVGVLGYAASGIIPQVEGLEWVKDYSPFTWLTGSEPLRNGVDAGHLGIMVGLSATLVVLGILAFRRRDVAV